MKVLVRADASSSIGVGHAARCLALAHALRELGAQVSFACCLLDGHRRVAIEQEGFEVFAWPQPQEAPGIERWSADIAALREVLPAHAEFDWVIVDHYALDARWEQAARAFAQRVAVIDDLGDRAHAADLLLDQNFIANEALYAPLLTPACRRLLGPRYALVRPAFQAAAISLAQQARRVLVSFGGFDVAGMLPRTLRALSELEGVQVTCIAGLRHPQRELLGQLCDAQAGWELHDYVDDLPARMAAADLFIGAGGGTTWERAALGLPSLCVSVAENQRANAEAMARAGMHLYLGEAGQVEVATLRQAIALLLDNQALRQCFAERSRALVDGRGAQRVAVALLGEGLALRLARIEDARLLFDGRNAPEVRRRSQQAQALDWPAHQAWLAATLADPQRLLLIAEATDGPVGSVRYDRLPGQRARVSLYLFSGRFGLGWGRALLARGEAFVRERWPDLRAIEAQVLPDNQASLQLFAGAGFVQSPCSFERVFEE
ncbi:UDP-2,4-diacetamido-2,4,6-trideoxy-beta-L-altropyranose hydrolase [Pseudomonas sp. Teo4]|uniref:UDP-2,4-diacetamido-2,4, 6-trideoxy-beta-L-altropyranose hydrolase n=1 Tax=Pseudomonas sp. Teo4 TaxID=3064528 RepID=UPI002AB907FA|nr:UDP-2,4-diacetamido-2,4,6-trideoxy-beta-L-altropyranose hydrolase [Pseudomonas sp. Teo4]MDZ3993196.1 UDP-N-acetylglucosamine--N-acetylmuramyl-(pentapeptide) pyrophosphoryl-undecaprenol N-acetylglucosamine transferase [Pseudomonas sp. Teo4]